MDLWTRGKIDTINTLTDLSLTINDSVIVPKVYAIDHITLHVVAAPKLKHVVGW